MPAKAVYSSLLDEVMYLGCLTQPRLPVGLVMFWSLRAARPHCLCIYVWAGQLFGFHTRGFMSHWMHWVLLQG
jgi:hypothetical protein